MATIDLRTFCSANKRCARASRSTEKATDERSAVVRILFGGYVVGQEADRNEASAAGRKASAEKGCTAWQRPRQGRARIAQRKNS